MAPFAAHNILDAFKERPEAVTVHGDHLYIGTSTGNLHVYTLDDHPENADKVVAQPVEVKKAFTRKAIERMAFLRDINSLVVLSDWTLTLFPLPNLSPPSVLAQARNAMSFTITSSVLPADKVKATPASVVTHLMVGCQKKVVLYTWKDGEPQETKEWSLPHSPRAIAFVSPRQAYMAYTAADIVLFNLDTNSITPVEFPAAQNASSLPANMANMANNIGMSAALTGFGNFVTLGLGAKAKPSLVKVGESEVLITRDYAGLFFGPDSKLSRLAGMEWPAAPEEINSVQNYLFAVLPASGGSPPSIQVRSSLSLQAAHTAPFPFGSTSPSPSSPTATSLRLLTPSAPLRQPVMVVSAPTDKTQLAAQGSTFWMFTMRPWGAQIDELVDAGKYPDALALLETLDATALPDQVARRRHIRALLAVSYFMRGDFDFAIDIFLELDVNPAKVVSLYPVSVAGRFATPRERWIELFGGRTPSPTVGEATTPPDGPAPPERPLSPQGSIIAGRLMGSLDMFLPAAATFTSSVLAGKDDDTASISDASKPSGATTEAAQSRRALEALMRYLSDRRPKYTGALAALGITAAAAPSYTRLSETPIADVLALPDTPAGQLVPQQLVRYAQVVYTALFKTYLQIRTSLVGSLCRIENWCEVAEVEEELRARKMFTDLADLYAGKKMHEDALKLLKELSADDDDPRDKLDPTVRYLHKLGLQDMDIIFKWARWTFDVNADIALKIFTLEESPLPRKAVVDYLRRIDPTLAMRYVEHLIGELHEEEPLFHDRLIDLYLESVTKLGLSGKTEERDKIYSKLLVFIRSSSQYHTDRLFAHLPNDDLFEARAILLGRINKHEAALEIYVYKLKNYIEAEEYCKRVYREDQTRISIFLLLLGIFLQPPPNSGSSPSALLKPALEFLARQSPRLDAQEAIKLLPPMVAAGSLKEFLVEAVRQPTFDTRVVREVAKSRKEEVERRLVAFQERRVKVDDSRICPQCHKRIGAISVIAVHLPRGEVTHYQCREAFSRRLRDGPTL
ncbi:hypothetical protein BKA62DRAFT_716172 [Auriculariales sp. MPI-PUGE-AT-0066]|nr:hypothetical protein BKA62DRAFT_716172 [Auriculariales sp. MPI-PUGE-AT-0066]